MKAWLVVAITLLAGGCQEVPPLEPVPAADLSAFEPSVRAAVSQAHERFEAAASGRAANDTLGAAYGELAMTYHAQDLTAPAEAAYRNAMRLAPEDRRWPHLLGHLYLDSSRLKAAIEAFEAAGRIDAGDPATLHAWGTAALRTGDTERARSLFERLAAVPGARAAAAAGLGKTALAVRDHRGAITHLEEALRLSPASSRLRQPLAAAYRALGDAERAQQHLARYAPDGAEPQVDDPAADALAGRVAVSQVLLRRGQRAARAGRLDLAEQAFRATVAADPGNAEAYANLGITLANLDRVAEAQAMLEQAVRRDGSIALAHFSLAIVHDRQDHLDAAIASYEAALKAHPGLASARFHLADALMRKRDAEAAAAHYEQVLQGRTDNVPQLRHALAVSHVLAGQHAKARKVLDDALAHSPNDAMLVDALVRVLSTAPDARVRDARRALALSRPWHERAGAPEAGEPHAMALAAAGRYAEAAQLQQDVIAQSRRDPAQAAFLAANLERYRRGRPAREAWPVDHPVFHPRSGAAARRVP